MKNKDSGNRALETKDRELNSVHNLHFVGAWQYHTPTRGMWKLNKSAILRNPKDASSRTEVTL
jgi:hypothetical protein